MRQHAVNEQKVLAATMNHYIVPALAAALAPEIDHLIDIAQPKQG